MAGLSNGVEHEEEEGSPQWMAWLGDRLCPRCGRLIKEVVPTHRGCARSYPCGHVVLRGTGSMARIHALWARAG